jgi:hypothetical protein
MSKIEVDAIEPQSGTTLTIGASGDTIIVPAGTVSLPAITTTGDTNTGIFFPAADTIAFTEGGAEAMRINSSGNVGIGTTTPNGILELKSSGNTNFFITAGNTSASQIVLGDTDDIDVGKIAYSHNGNTMEFIVNASERMRIDSSGTVKATTFTNRTTILNTIDPSPDDTNTFEIANGYIHLFRDDTATVKQVVFGKNGSEVGNITTTGDATAYNTSSDYRLKENVNYNFDATTRLKQLKPARFNFIRNADKTVDGFLAHEVSSVVPEAVTGTHNEVKTWKEHEELPEGVSVGDNKLDENGNTIPDYQGIDQSKLVPLLVKTIQELEARITALENA